MERKNLFSRVAEKNKNTCRGASVIKACVHRSGCAIRVSRITVFIFLLCFSGGKTSRCINPSSSHETTDQTVFRFIRATLRSLNIFIFVNSPLNNHLCWISCIEKCLKHSLLRNENFLHREILFFACLCVDSSIENCFDKSAFRMRIERENFR